VFNGILLAAHLDAAFDAALLSFDENGIPLLSRRLSKEAANMLDHSLRDQPLALTDRHQFYLQHHRSRFQKLST
jgi:hypothetical protein